MGLPITSGHYISNSQAFKTHLSNDSNKNETEDVQSSHLQGCHPSCLRMPPDNGGESSWNPFIPGPFPLHLGPVGL